MKITIESTTKVIKLVMGDTEVPARVWQGETEDGIPVQVFVTRIAPEVPKSDPDIDAKLARFERELVRCNDPRPTIDAIPFRMFID